MQELKIMVERQDNYSEEGFEEETFTLDKDYILSWLYEDYCDFNQKIKEVVSVELWEVETFKYCLNRKLETNNSSLDTDFKSWVRFFSDNREQVKMTVQIKWLKEWEDGEITEEEDYLELFTDFSY